MPTNMQQKTIISPWNILVAVCNLVRFMFDEIITTEIVSEGTTLMDIVDK